MQTAAPYDASMASALDLTAFDGQALERTPFDHLVLPRFIRPEALAEIDRDFPAISKGGSFPAGSLPCGPAFQRLLDELQGPDVTRAFEEKFGMDLSGRPTMVTLRGYSREKDGRIHTDSHTKLITALIYLNGDWESDGGRLRLLKSANDIEDYVAEVPPDAGTLITFRCSDNAYHGHKPFIGTRRSIQLNWLTDEATLKRELGRHGVSAFFKQITKPFQRSKR
ncbi:MAG: 2OG-Fe(II) oxygenase [Pseudomonadota bacterium]